MDEIVHLQTFGACDHSLIEAKEHVAQVESIARYTETLAKEYGRTDVDREALCLTVFYQSLVGDIKSWFEYLDTEVQENWEWLKEEFFYWLGQTSQERSYRIGFYNQVQTMQQGTKTAAKFLQECKVLSTLAIDKDMTFLVAQAFVKGLNSYKVRQELDDILPKGFYDFQDIYLAFGKLRSRRLVKTSLTVSSQVLPNPVMICTSTILEVSSATVVETLPNPIEMTSEVLKLPAAPTDSSTLQRESIDQLKGQELEKKQPTPTSEVLVSVAPASEAITKLDRVSGASQRMDSKIKEVEIPILEARNKRVERVIRKKPRMQVMIESHHTELPNQYIISTDTANLLESHLRIQRRLYNWRELFTEYYHFSLVGVLRVGYMSSGMSSDKIRIVGKIWQNSVANYWWCPFYFPARRRFRVPHDVAFYMPSHATYSSH